MRISDWSSDVCSSDLDRFLATFTFNGRSATGTLRTAMNVLIELAGDWRKALPADIPFGHIELRWHRHVMNGGKIDRTYWELATYFGVSSALASGDLWEIGRASCRERGGPYV